ncbi:hypothetical protein SXCC_00352 [Gluconacetobacter sp. SXCC-1]|nr:hypothetical protein SXCC_00352 [Gluconacetobacter sp. SXCC-1]
MRNGRVAWHIFLVAKPEQWGVPLRREDNKTCDKGEGSPREAGSG